MAALDFSRRSSGVLLHLTSLPGPLGSGDLSRDAHRFVDLLANAGQTWWQMLPVGPPGEPPWNSPYSSSSSFAGSPYLIGMEGLADDGLLPRKVATQPPSGASSRSVNFPVVNRHRERLLREAFEQFRSSGGARDVAFREFREEAADWLDDYALFRALRSKHRGRSWVRWERDLRDRKPAAMRRARAELAAEMDYRFFEQFQFDRQWRSLRSHAQARGVGLIGDVPIFVSHDSADVWANRPIFELDREGRPTRVSGCPPDMFCETGQLWGHPQFRWAAHVRSDFDWWVRRLRRTFELFDAVRIDHFLGFARVWSVPASAKTAQAGRWVPSPGRQMLAAFRKHLGNLPIIAEDLGDVSDEAIRLRDDFGLPGMRVLQFGFASNGGGDPLHRPHAYPRRCVAYTGTHDNETTAGWFRGLDRATKRRVQAYCGGSDAAPHRDLVRTVMASHADTAIVPLQDVLGLDNRARMNRPGIGEGNWGWRVEEKRLAVAGRQLKEWAEAFDRRAPSRSQD